MKITMIGAGAMGGTTVEGLLRSGAFSNSDVCVADPSATVLQKFSNLGVQAITDNATAARQADIVCVCVKPWLVERVLTGIKDALSPQRQLLVVIAAGVASKSIKEWLGAQCPPLFLVIPNIAIAQLSSMTFIVPVGTAAGDATPYAGATDEQTRVVRDIFGRMGQTLLTDEQHLAAGTTLASCGIAYAMRYIRAAAEGGVELGFKADEAKEIVMQTVLGAVRLLEASGLHPEAAIDMVTTPGGVTIKGLNEMEHAGFTSSVIRGLKAGAK